MPKPTRSGLAALPALAIILAVALVLAGAAYFTTRDRGDVATNAYASNANAATNANTNAIVPADWQTFSHPRGFSFRYPSDWEVVAPAADSAFITLTPTGQVYNVEDSPTYPVYVSLSDDTTAEYIRDVDGSRLSTVKIGANTLTRLAPTGTISSAAYLLDLREGSLSFSDHVDELLYTNNITTAQATVMRGIYNQMLASLTVSR